MLEINNLHVEVEHKEILSGIDLKIKAGEMHAIMGLNGSGKVHFPMRLLEERTIT